jgi:DNA-binding response OmpR family regulator
MPATLKNLTADTTRRENLTLLVSPDQDDHRALTDMLEADHWTVRGARSFAEAMRLLGEAQMPAVVACERELPDGDWKDLFQAMNRLTAPPPLVVLSRHADEFLWAEVLNMGGYDLLAKPFEQSEVHRVLAMARRHGSDARMTVH